MFVFKKKIFSQEILPNSNESYKKCGCDLARCRHNLEIVIQLKLGYIISKENDQNV